MSEQADKQRLTDCIGLQRETDPVKKAKFLLRWNELTLGERHEKKIFKEAMLESQRNAQRNGDSWLGW